MLSCCKNKTRGNKEGKTTPFIALTLLTETHSNVEEYSGHSEALTFATVCVLKHVEYISYNTGVAN